jgi:two-component system, LytTR family, sensor kinase
MGIRRRRTASVEKAASFYIYVYLYRNKRMPDHPFILSDQPRYRRARHFVLWVIYGAYFTAQSYFPTGAVRGISPHFIKMAFLSTAMFLPFCAVAMYVLLYYLYPRYLQRGGFRSFGLRFLALFFAGIFMNYWTSRVFYHYSAPDTSHVTQAAFLGLHNTVIAIIISIFLLGIRLGRNAYIQQQANLLLARQKARTELQLLKTRIDPDFLFHTLDQLRVMADAGVPELPSAILRLSDKLSDILYGEEEETVHLTEATHDSK